MRMIVSIDPGRKKCGLLLADLDAGIVVNGMVVEEIYVVELLTFWRQKYSFQKLLLGNGTTSNYWASLLNDLAPLELVEEGGSTLRAKERYWELWPPGPLLGWVPKGLLLPPHPLDAVAALVLLEDYLGKELNWFGSPNFKIEI